MLKISFPPWEIEPTTVTFTVARLCLCATTVFYYCLLYIYFGAVSVHERYMHKKKCY